MLERNRRREKGPAFKSNAQRLWSEEAGTGIAVIVDRPSILLDAVVGLMGNESQRDDSL